MRATFLGLAAAVAVAGFAVGPAAALPVSGLATPDVGVTQAQYVIRFPIDCFAMRKSASLKRRAGW